MKDSKPRVAVLLSGRGSNYEALARAVADGELEVEIALVLSNIAGAGGLDTAQEFGHPTRVVEHRGMKRSEHEAEVLSALAEARVEWVVLAGYMRLLSADFVGEYPQRILNIHPSLLPSFPGLHVHEQVLEHGAKVSGCTVHLVDAGLDSGPIVEQRTVPVLDGDTPASLAARVLEQEHRAYKSALGRLVDEPWRIDGRRVLFGDDSVANS